MLADRAISSPDWFGHLRRWPIERWLALCALLAGLAAWLVYLRADLVLSHYDAKAHLVVARRAIDSLTPGWRQIGAVWLPLPHLINLLPSQVDFFYRTGAFASIVSIGCLAVLVGTTARFVRLVTGSAAGATTAAALLLFNPNLLYLHATPMTEPLLLAVTFTALLWLYEWARDGGPRPPARLCAVLFASMWTRYEAWPIVCVALAASAYALWRYGTSMDLVIRRVGRLAMFPALAVLLFLLNGRIATGAWFVAGGFYERDPLYEGRAMRDVLAVWWGTHRLSGYVVEIVALASASVVCVRALTRRDQAPVSIALACLAGAALPIYAFFAGHPFRIRYMIPEVAACALLAGFGVGFVDVWQRASTGLSRLRHVPAAGAVLLVASLLIETPRSAPPPLLEEATWDAAASEERRAVTACLAARADGDKVLASMGSLAHYMQELSDEGIRLSDFIHEGNGAIWQMALETGPLPHAAWMLTEEQSEGGDVLSQRIRQDPSFTQGLMRMCEGGGVALYGRARKE